MKASRLPTIIKPLENMLRLYGFKPDSAPKETKSTRRGSFSLDGARVDYSLNVKREKKTAGLYSTDLELKVGLHSGGNTTVLCNEHVTEEKSGYQIVRDLVRRKVRSEVYSLKIKKGYG